VVLSFWKRRKNMILSRVYSWTYALIKFMEIDILAWTFYLAIQNKVSGPRSGMNRSKVAALSKLQIYDAQATLSSTS